jgi:hypothetical protein
MPWASIMGWDSALLGAPARVLIALIGAGDEARTRDIDLGRVALYQLSYSRPPDAILEGMCSDSYSDSGEEGV